MREVQASTEESHVHTDTTQYTPGSLEPGQKLDLTPTLVLLSTSTSSTSLVIYVLNHPSIFKF